ncbi:hypothetical protein POL68_27025 [Stigmatella sp. ncwal1]|uniref:PIN domain-containing protein n=1 Tax=Stigmatella ashevillensis TaxID=2995309 RepID=A0ABT5DGF3_9BACT|nr:hypothetical protein [Stigmatella ashevillena]MDC0712149.1 hypothetical protein [Stigmatella ashevillena]
MSICLVDTSVFCELLRVPNMDQRHAEVIAEFEKKLKIPETLLLPMTTVLETGNHIGQQGDGRQRREAASRFTAQVRRALEGRSPFAPTRLLNRESLLEWLDEFPEWALKGSGLGDLSILKDFEHQCALHRGRRVYIWSLDVHLSCYDRAATL